MCACMSSDVTARQGGASHKWCAVADDMGLARLGLGPPLKGCSKCMNVGYAHDIHQIL